MFLFKKIVSQFFFPMPLCLGLCFIGLALLWWTRRQKAGKVLLTVGLMALTMLSYRPVADALLLPLERQYPVYVTGASPPAKFIVVLGGGHSSDPTLPVTSQIGDESLKRLVEGIRVFRENPNSKLVLSGGAWRDRVPEATVLRAMAKLLGVRDEDIITESESRDTNDEARVLRTLIRTNSMILVTSATHMPRSIALFRANGMEPQAACAEHLVARRFLEPDTFFPSGRTLRRTERAFYEYLGLSWQKFGGS